MKEIRVILAVTNDLFSDQRVHRIATSLVKLNFKVCLVGCKFKGSQKLYTRSYITYRFWIFFPKKVFFYAEYNIRLFFFLLFKKIDILVANDLDTLPACYIISLLKKVKLVYDSHEYFTQVPELINRKFVQNIWISIEKFILPRLKYAYTVNDSLVAIYMKKYNLKFHVFRNMPFCCNNVGQIPENFILPKNNKYSIIYQGSLNEGRGIELMIMAMKYLPEFKFIVIGGGYLINELKNMVKQLSLDDKVQFLGKIALENLHYYTKQADIGISLEQNLGLNYFYSLPNKIFDYIQANIPVLTSAFPEMKAIVEKYDIGMVTDINQPEKLAQLIMDIFNNKELLSNWHKNLVTAAKELNWEKEETKVIDFYRNLSGITK